VRADAEFSGGCLRAAVVSGAMTDIVSDNHEKLAGLLEGRQDWRPEVQDGERFWCFRR
jgi:hypothetical protein